MKKISFVVPCCNEEGNIEKLFNEVKSTIKSEIYNYEFLFIDDGSTDNSLTLLKKLALKYSNVFFISFSRNFGHQSALRAGFDFSTGDCVISLDADLQHPPLLIVKMLEEWENGFLIVNTIRKDSKDTTFFKRITSKYFYGIINFLSDVNIMQGASDFRLLDRKVVDHLVKLRESSPFYRGLVSWVGYSCKEIVFEPNKRYSGKTKYSVKKMFQFASTGITSFSTKPLYLSVYLGLLISFISFCYSIFALYGFIFESKNIEGWTSLILSILFIGGVQLIMLGIIGEYLGKLFIESKKRPDYIINELNI